MKQMAVWIDHQEARIFHVDARNFDEKTVAHAHKHSKGGDNKVENHPDDDHRFFRDVAHQLAGAEQVLVLGPGVTKAQFFKYAGEHNQALASQIVAVEDADHPSDKQIVAHVRHHFHIDPPRRTGV